MVIRRSAYALGLMTIALVVAAGAQAQPSGLTTFLPHSGDVPGWNVAAAAERDATTEKGLYDMYDGAVPDMQKRGVCFAHQRTYKNGSGKSLTVDIYTLYTWQWAKAYYLTEKTGIKSLPGFQVWQVKQEACAAQTAGSTTVFMWAKNYAASVTLQGASASDLKTAKAFATSVSNKISAYKSH